MEPHDRPWMLNVTVVYRETTKDTTQPTNLHKIGEDKGKSNNGSTKIKKEAKYD